MNKIYADAVVIGGGVIGTAVTYYLTKSGLKPILVEQHNLNAGSSGTCDEGIILQSKSPGIVLDMVKQSASIYKSLQDELGYDIGYRNSGGLILIDDEKFIPLISDMVKKQQAQGIEITMLDRKETHEKQPGLSPKVIASAYSKNDSSVYPFKLTLGYTTAARALGARFLFHNKVIKIRKYRKKVRKVITNEYEISTPVVVDCSGVGSREIGKMAGVKIPILPIKGHLVITEQVPPLVLQQIIDARFISAKHNPDLINKSRKKSGLNIGLSISQARTGNLIIGGSREKGVYNTDTSLNTVKEILKNAVNYIPALKNISIIRAFAGLRPSSPDGIPILSRTPIEGFYIASGLGGDGISLSPLVGKTMSELVVEGKCELIDMSLLSCERFLNSSTTI